MRCGRIDVGAVAFTPHIRLRSGVDQDRVSGVILRVILLLVFRFNQWRFDQRWFNDGCGSAILLHGASSEFQVMDQRVTAPHHRLVDVGSAHAPGAPMSHRSPVGSTFNSVALERTADGVPASRNDFRRSILLVLQENWRFSRSARQLWRIVEGFFTETILNGSYERLFVIPLPGFLLPGTIKRQSMSKSFRSIDSGSTGASGLYLILALACSWRMAFSEATSAHRWLTASSRSS